MNWITNLVIRNWEIGLFPSLQVAVDSISHIRTVAALGLEDVFFERFTKNVMVPYRLVLSMVYTSNL